MLEVTFKLEFKVYDTANILTEVIIQNKTVDVMKGGVVRSMLTRRFNYMLRNASKNHIVTATYYGQLSDEPYTMYSGGLTGVNGKVSRRDGEMDWV